jgi:hypothetical protein
VRNWWYRENDLEAGRATVAWTGQNPDASKNNATLCLFKRTWESPRPEAEVESIDFTSRVTESAPFLIALTVE